MAHDLTVTPKSPALTTITVPDGGDTRTAASVTVPMGGIFNALMFIWGVLTGTIAQTVNIDGDINTVSGNITADGGITATHDITADGSFRGFQDFHIDGNSQVDGFSSVNGQLTVGGTSRLNGATVASGPVSFASNGRIVKRIISQVGAAGMTANVGTASHYHFPTAASGSTIQISDSNAVDGDELTFSTFESTNDINILSPSGAGLATLRYTVHPQWQTIARIGGSWKTTLIGPSS